MIHVFGAEL